MAPVHHATSSDPSFYRTCSESEEGSQPTQSVIGAVANSVTRHLWARGYSECPGSTSGPPPPPTWADLTQPNTNLTVPKLLPRTFGLLVASCLPDTVAEVSQALSHRDAYPMDLALVTWPPIRDVRRILMTQDGDCLLERSWRWVARGQGCKNGPHLQTNGESQFSDRCCLKKKIESNRRRCSDMMWTSDLYSTLIRHL